MLKTVLETVLTEGGMDIVIVNEIQMTALTSSAKKHEGRFSGPARGLTQVPVDLKKRLGKPIVMVLPVFATGADAVEFEGARRNARDYYLGEGIPVYLTLERAAKALANLVGYYQRRDATSSLESSN